MTLNANDVRDEYTATSSQTIFNYTFKIYDSTDLDVYVTPAGQECSASDLTTAYTVSGVGDEDGGSITLTTPATLNDLVTIVSSIPTSRTTDYQNNGDFRPDTVNDDFDRTVSLVKQAVDQSNRALVFPDCLQSVTQLSLPQPVDSSFLRWKSDLSGMENFTFSSTGIVAEVSVTNYAALRALTSGDYTDGQVIYVTNDGIAGAFVVKTGAVTQVVGIREPFTDDSNRYAERVYNGACNALWTAAGDGVTDDKGAIQSVIDYLSNGDTLHIPEASSFYLIDATQLSEAILVDKEINIILDGELRGTTFVNQTNPPYTMYVTADNVNISGRGKLSGDGTIVQVTTLNDTDPGFIKATGDNFTVDGIIFERYPQIGVYVLGDGSTVKNCRFEGYATSTAGGIQYFATRFEGPTTGSQVLNNTFTSYDSTHHNINTITLLGSAHEDALISGNYCDAQFDQVVYANLNGSIVSHNIGTKGPYDVRGQGIKINSGSGNNVSHNNLAVLETSIQLINVFDTVCDGNKIKGFDLGYGINVYDNTGSGSAMDNIVISNNVIVGDVSGPPTSLNGGINFNPNVDSDNILIEGNVLRDVGYDETSEGGISILPNSGVTVTNAVIRNNIVTGSLNRYGIYALRCDDVTINDNRVIFEATSGTAPLRGIYLNNVTGAEVDGNYINNTLFATVSMDFGILNATATNLNITNNTVLGWNGSGGPPWPFGSGNNVVTFGNRIDDTDLTQGVVTLGAAATTVVSNTNIASSNRTNGSIFIELTPINTPAATLVGSTKSPYISALTLETDFTIATADATAAAGTEIFAYKIVQ